MLLELNMDTLSSLYISICKNNPVSGGKRANFFPKFTFLDVIIHVVIMD